MKYTGTREDLVAAIESHGLTVEIRDVNAGIQFRTNDGAILNWYPGKGTVVFQGDPTASAKLQASLATILGGADRREAALKASVPSKLSSAVDVTPAKVEVRGRVFVVHGHDTVAREQLELVLHRLGLDPFVLQNTGGGGLTIIEALEKEIGASPTSVKFGIVLLTPDDFGYSKADGPTSSQPRARQNVVLEMGMMLSSIGRTNVAILKKGHLEVPSDAQGILYLAFNDHVREVVPRLVDRLTAAGFVLDGTSITKAAT